MARRAPAVPRRVDARDLFAMAALQGVLANPDTFRGEGTCSLSEEDIATVAYAYADAMLAERKRKRAVPHVDR